MGRKANKGHAPWESIKGGKFTKLYADMLTSEAYTDLSPQEKELYTCCKNEAHARAMNDNGGHDQSLFYMNRGLYVNHYRIYSEGDKRGFQRDMAALIEHGFVDLVESGYADRGKSLYRMSSRWRDYGTPRFTVPDSVKTTHMHNEEKKGVKTEKGCSVAP